MLKIHNNNNSIKNSAETSTPTGKAPKPPKSISPEKLKKSKSPTHDLENVDLSMMSKPFLTSCYDLARCLMNREKGTSPVPPPPSALERRRLEGYFNVSPDAPADSAGIRIQQREVVSISSNSRIDQDYIDYVHGTMRRWGITRFTMAWDDNYDDRYNQIMGQFFLRVWKWGITFGRFGLVVQAEASKINMDELILMAIYWRHTKSLRQYYKRGAKGEEVLLSDQVKNTIRQALKRKSIFWQLYLQQQGVHINFIKPFDDTDANSEDEIIIENNTPIALPKSPAWRSQRATEFIDWIEAKRRSQRVSSSTLRKKTTYGCKATLRPRRRPQEPIIDEDALIPVGLPEDWYASDFLASLSFADKKVLKITPPIFHMIGDFQFILPQTAENLHSHPLTAHISVINKEKKKAQHGRGRFQFDECEFEEEQLNTLIKIEEDKEML
ncbi:hypothetical protein PSHT_07998 [Puccinia striiformis]|uniref:Uncharacterized protein n=1 Tax=Puccinia striiformis TaxID=27350 RepID=A0A2S4VT51_9BASI|nr:hypothetical protein PSHT_07998 [Puccinia striiformis]